MGKVIVNCGSQFGFDAWIVPAGDWHGEFLGVNVNGPGEDMVAVAVVSVWNHEKRRLELFERECGALMFTDMELAAQSPNMWLVHAFLSLPTFPSAMRSRLIEVVTRHLLERAVEQIGAASALDAWATDVRNMLAGEFSLDAIAWVTRGKEALVKQVGEALGDG